MKELYEFVCWKCSEYLTFREFMNHDQSHADSIIHLENYPRNRVIPL